METRTNLPASYARILFRHLRLTEKNCGRFFADTTVSYNALMTLDSSISPADLDQIYRNALALSKCNDLGLSVGSQLHMSAHGPLGIAAFSSPNLRTALNLLVRYNQIRADYFDVGINQTADGVAFTLTETYDLADLRIFLTESVLSGLFWAIGIFTGDSPFIGRVSFSYAKPEYWQSYKDRFGDDLSFEHPFTEVIIPEQLLSLPSPVADPAMHKDAIANCERLLSERNAARSTTETVTTLMSDNPGVIWTLGDVAANLHMGPRTLMRRLDGEGTKFQTLRDNLSKQQAANYLADRNLSVESVGYLMGFSDASSFRRSFKRWFGETPSAYIARVRGND